MEITVGIPQALLFYNYYPLWETYLTALGARVVISGPTNSRIVNLGIRAAVDEACLPVKLFFGHVLELADRADLLFLPRLVSVERKAYICPKLMGLPDMIRHNFPELPPLIDVCFDQSRRPKSLHRSLSEVGEYFTSDRRRLEQAYTLAVARQAEYEACLQQGMRPEQALAHLAGGETWPEPKPRALTIGVLGHPYTLYDAYLNQGILAKLEQAGATVVTPEMLPPAAIRAGLSHLRKDLFWTLGRRVLGAAYHCLAAPGIDGIIHLTAFGCGPDSLVGELAELQAKRTDRIPFMLLNLDEHSGEAGLETRLEAFLDMLARRGDKNAGNLSPYGDDVRGGEGLAAVTGG